MKNNDTINQSLPDSFHESIAQVLRDGNAKEIATRLGRSHFHVLHWADDPEQTHRPIPSHMIIPFCLAANDFRPIAWLCRQVGAVFVPLQKAHGKFVTSREMAKLAADFSEVLKGYSDAIEDEMISDCERIEIIERLDALIDQSVRFREALR